MKKTKFFLGSAVFLMFPTLSFAQSVRGKINEILADYIIPTFIVFMVIAIIVGLVKNFDLIEDRNNEGTRVKGFVNASLLVLYVFIGELIIGSCVVVLAAINISI